MKKQIIFLIIIVLFLPAASAGFWNVITGRVTSDTSGEQLNIYFTADNLYGLYVNEQFIGSTIGTVWDWADAEHYIVNLRDGKNVIAVKATNINLKGGIFGEFLYSDKRFITDASWKYSLQEQANWNKIAFDDSSWSNAIVHGKSGDYPWTQVRGFPTLVPDTNWIWSQNNGYANADPVVYFRYSFEYISSQTNQPPEINIQAAPTSGIAPLSVDLKATGVDSDGYITTYKWNFGDGQSSTLQNVIHIFQNPGSYNVVVTATDDEGAVASNTVLINVSSQPAEPMCVDSDNGLNYNVYGVCTKTTPGENVQTHNDLCQGDLLHERYCQQNGCASNIYKCPNGCKDGKCIGSNEIVCGDGFCNGAETCLNCAEDCGACNATEQTCSGKPDLTVTDIEITLSNPQVGQSVNRVSKVKNLGGVASPVVNIKCYVDDKQTCYGSFGPLQPGATVADYSHNVGWGGPWIAVVGTHKFEWVIDADNHANECNETNNRFVKYIIASGDIPITNCQELQNMKNNLAGNYYLTKDIDCSDTKNWNSGQGFEPVGKILPGGNWLNTGTEIFTGSFDGKVYKITGLYINRPSTSQVSLFGVAGSPSEIKNVGLENVNIKGYHGVGGLVGYNRDNLIISNSYSTGNVNGAGLGVGGLVGYNSAGSISNSYSTANVIGSEDVGGLVGGNLVSATISNSYSTGSVSGRDDIGGLVGNNAGTITNSYSTGSVSGNSNFGGLVGNGMGSVSNSYWDTQTSGRTTSKCGTGKTTAEMKQKSTFTGWDFTNTWGICEGSSYPWLKWENKQCLQVCSDGTQYGQCSTTKLKYWKYCDNGVLKDNCQTCGCPTGQACQTSGVCNATQPVPGIICKVSSDCGTTGYTGNYFCLNGDVFRVYTTYVCVGAGTPNATCVYYSEQKLVDDCTANEKCVNGNAVCQVTGPVCGDLVCSSGENCTTCLKDCGACNVTVPTPKCKTSSDCGITGYTGNYFCLNGDVYREYTTYVCAGPGTPNATCVYYGEQRLVDDCTANEQCVNGNAVCQAVTYTCGDGVCSVGETKTSCLQDCKVCGDNACDAPYETTTNCATDCLATQPINQTYQNVTTTRLTSQQTEPTTAESLGVATTTPISQAATIPESICAGCFVEKKCLSIGVRTLSENQAVYCGNNRQLNLMKEGGSGCSKDYECISNICKKDICLNIEEIENKNVLQDLLDFLAGIFS